MIIACLDKIQKNKMRHGNKRDNKKRPPPSPSPLLDAIATRTRAKRRTEEATWDVPIPVIIRILNWLDLESLINSILVSKQFHEIICNGPGIDLQNEIPLLIIHPRSEQNKVGGGSTKNLLLNFENYLMDDDTTTKLRRFRRIKVNHLHKFGCIDDELLYSRIENSSVQMDWIFSLDISSSLLTTLPNHSLCYALSHMLPNLSEIDLSNTDTSSIILTNFSQNCPRLEKVKWNKIQYINFIFLSGSTMKYSDNLKEIVMDDSCFFCWNNTTKERMSNAENYPDIFVFHQCCKVLERFSLRNAKWSMNDLENQSSAPIPQDALIKFVQNAPSTMKWFRSDLTKENMEMLQLERPDIGLLN